MRMKFLRYSGSAILSVMETYLSIVAPLFESIVTVRPDNPRAMAPDELAAIYRESGAEARAFGDFDRAVAFALDEAKRRGVPLFAAGSLYMYAQFVGALDFNSKE